MASTAQPAADTAFPPIDRTCAADSDCTLDWHYQQDNGKCCSAGCQTKAVSIAWQKRVEAFCGKQGYDSDCPTKSCAMPSGTRCDRALCVLVP